MLLSVASNFRWLVIAQVGRVGIQLLSVIIMSRILSPADFGLMAMATVVMNFGLLFRDMGTSSALIQARDLSEGLLDSVLLLNVIFGFAFGAFVVVTAPIGAWLFSATELTGVLMAIAVMLPLASTTAPHLALLERHGEFRSIAWIEVSSSLAGFIAGISFALLGGGVYSFVLQAVITAAVSAVQLWSVSKWRPGRLWSAGELRKILKFSGNLVAYNLMVYLARNVDSALIGRFLGPVSLGWYSAASRLLLFPLQNLNFMVHRALLPVYSRSQDALPDIAALYLKTLTIIAAISAPAMFGLWATREPVVDALLGQKWGDVAQIFAWMAPMGFVQSLNFTTGTVLTAVGRTGLLKNLGVMSAVTTVCAFLIGLQFGLAGLVQAYFYATVVCTLVSLHVALKAVHSNIRVLARRIASPVLCAAAMAAAVFLLNNVLYSSLSTVLRLAVLLTTGIAVYGGLLFIFARSTVDEMRKSGIELFRHA